MFDILLFLMFKSLSSVSPAASTGNTGVGEKDGVIDGDRNVGDK
jgi:hypothetical protein